MAIKYTENPVSCNFQKPSITAEFNMVKFLIFFKIKHNYFLFTLKTLTAKNPGGLYLIQPIIMFYFTFYLCCT